MKKTLCAVVLVLVLAASAWGAMSDEQFAELCEHGSVQEIRNALLQGANPNAKGKYGWTALMWAATSDTSVVSLLLKAGADVNARDDDGVTALRRAAGGNTNPDVLSVLLKAGADVNAKDDYGYTALMSAAEYNTSEIVSLLLKAEADVNAKDEVGSTALRRAARGNTNPDVLSVLLKAGADVNAKSYNGKTALDLAREANNTGAIKLLETATAGPASQGNPEALYRVGIKYLTGDGVKVDEQRGRELLRRAAGQGHQKAKDALKLLK